jgi:lysophospholipase L1-like esterase
LSDAVSKTFHPTPAGHAATAAELVQRLFHRKPSEGDYPQNKILNILSIGDSITWGFRSTDGSGYRKPLYDILTPSNSVSFIGSQGSGNGSQWERSEDYPGYKVQGIVDKVVNSTTLDERPNLILLTASTNDVNAVNISSFADFLPVLNALEFFVDILKAHTAVTVYYHYTNDPLRPNDEGYQKLADNWAERINCG